MQCLWVDAEVRDFFDLTVLGTAMVAVLTAACGRSEPPTAAGEDLGAPSLLGTLVAAVPDRRPLEARLSGGFAHVSCASPAEAGELIAEPRCSGAISPGTPEFERLAAIASDIFPSVEHPSAERLHLQALWHLLWHHTDGALEQAITKLEAAAELAPAEAAIRSDLAAAYLVRAQRRDEPFALVRALSANERALELDRASPEARFNQALVLTHLHLAREATKAWEGYLELDRRSGWAGEARRRIAALRAVADEWPWEKRRARLEEAATRGDHATVARLVDTFRQPAREYAQEVLFARWADAHRRGAGAEAESVLRGLDEIGRAVAAASGDFMVHDAVATIAGAAGQDSRRRLAALVDGHRLFADGWAAYNGGRYARAAGMFSTAERRLLEGRSPFAAWATFQRAICEYYAADYEEAFALLERVEDRSEISRYPALLGRVFWIRGLLHLVSGEPTDALHFYRLALRRFRELGEAGNVATIHLRVAGALQELGQEGEAWRHRYLGLSRGPRSEPPYRTYAKLVGAADACLGNGFPRAALPFIDELITATRFASRPDLTAENLRWRSRVLHQLGRGRDAERDLEAAVAAIESTAGEPIDESENYRWRILADIALARGELAGEQRPEAAVAALSTALDHYRSAGYRLELPLAYRLRARAHLRLGRHDRAEADLLEGIVEIERFRAAVSTDAERESYFAQVRGLFEEMIAFQIDVRGDAAVAFDYFERSRARGLLDRRQKIRTGDAGELGRPLESRAIRERLAPGVAVVAYSLLPDRLTTWIVTRDRLVVERTASREEELANLIDEMVARIAARADRDELRAPSEALFDRLLRRPLDLLPAGCELVLIPDKAIHLVPFAALVDRRSGRYLIADHDLSIAPSATLYARTAGWDAGPAGGAGARVLVVGDPRFDHRLLPELPQLPGSLQEAEGVAAIYPRSRLLTDRAATGRRFLELFPEQDVVHFAGHAVLHPRFPEKSYLVFAREDSVPGVAGLQILTAQEIASKSLSGPRLVVLSACHGGSSRVATNEGPLNLARAFMAGGVPTVLASLWAVDDRFAGELLVEMHRGLRAGVPPQAALRRAQLALLRHRNDPLRHPFHWAGFQLIGPPPSIPKGKN